MMQALLVVVMIVLRMMSGLLLQLLQLLRQRLHPALRLSPGMRKLSRPAVCTPCTPTARQSCKCRFRGFLLLALQLLQVRAPSAQRRMLGLQPACAAPPPLLRATA